MCCISPCFCLYVLCFLYVYSNVDIDKTVCDKCVSFLFVIIVESYDDIMIGVNFVLRFNCVYVCLWVGVCVNVCACLWVCLCLYLCVCICLCMCVCVCVLVSVSAWPHVCLYTRIPLHLCIRIHIQVHRPPPPNLHTPLTSRVIFVTLAMHLSIPSLSFRGLTAAAPISGRSNLRRGSQVKVLGTDIW